ncbi:hypothetical protein HMPREF1008_01190 [Olsenella sp. oral taxon 809 str. F0356]|uniref:J domain-containing protein n=2 Tax=Olsenella TaxID=133925 RepID=UPI000231ED75|nr:J domain-containing protein [Olsenella sp. oral taxon 809]EHF01566.1 hypothetical protein HMPREF1008_01190 [Olsenella sp. oral taxon 809 str. F0356]
MRQDMTQAQAEEALELPDRYGKAELRAAFKRLAQEYHPDNAAKNGISPRFAQRKMTEVNKAYAVLKPLFEGDRATVQRDLVGGSVGRHGVGVHFDPAGRNSTRTQVDDSLFWDEEGNPRSAAAERDANAAADAPGHGLRRLLLGPWLIRSLLVLAFALLWYRTFPFVGGNEARFDLGPAAGLGDWARTVAACVYPSYLLLYELFAGHLSGTLREAANGLVSHVTRIHVEVRRQGAYQSSLADLIEKQWYGILMLPLVLVVCDWALARQDVAQRMAILVLAALLGLDALLSCFGSGVANGIARRLAQAVEKRYVTARMELLRRCGQWSSGRHAAHAS